MAIYTRFGPAVEFISAVMVPMWMEIRYSEIRNHYSPPKQTKQNKIEEMPTWHVTAKYVDDGSMLLDGKLMPAGNFVADDGIREIHERIYELVPDWHEKWETWNKGPDQTEVWPMVDKSQIA